MANRSDGSARSPVRRGRKEERRGLRRIEMTRSTLLLFAAFVLNPLIAQDGSWRTVQVPGPRAASEAPGADGVAWYRAWVKVNDSFFAKHERNLFEESVGVNIRDLAG